MNNLHLIIYFLLASSIFYSCMEEEEPIYPVYNPGDKEMRQVYMNDDYRYQVFFSFAEGKEVSRNRKTAWDMAFSTSGDQVLLNTSKAMKAAETSKDKAEDVTDTTGLKFIWDASSLHPDSTAIGNWKGETGQAGKIYVIDKGFDETGKYLGLEKVRIVNRDDNTWKIQHAPLSGTDMVTKTVNIDPLYNYVYLSFENGQVYVAPPADQWDICFTQYLHTFYDPVLPYLVTGVLSNPGKVASTELNDSRFDRIDFEKASTLDYSSDADIIGYDWKEYSFDTGSFNLIDKYFIIKASDDYYYKLRFIDFYNNQGEKGYPTFEYQRL